MELTATTLGVHPLPDPAKDQLANLKGHQKEDLISGQESEAVESAYSTARSRDLEIQQNAGLDYVVEGQLRWDDMLAHPLTVADGVETGGLVRYYDNNNFYRDPQITGPLGPSGDIGQDLSRISSERAELAAIVPGPWTLTDLASNEYYGDEKELLEAITELLVEEIQALPSHSTLLIPSPSLVTQSPGSDLGSQVSSALDSLADATETPVCVMPFYGVPDEPTYAHLLDADIGVGFDLVSDHEGAIDLGGEYGTTQSIGLGVINGRHSAVEDVETIRDRVEWFVESLPSVSVPEHAYLTPNSELFYLPSARYQSKLEALGTATALQEVTP